MLHIFEEMENLITKGKAMLSPAAQAHVKDVENAAHDIEHKAVDYLKAHALQDAYTLATTLLTGAIAGAPWGELLTSLIGESVKMGKDLLHQDAAIVLGQAQVDLIAAGKLIPPGLGA